jgi:DNA invertase Pin-like site-specific DNA recombinase
MDVVRRLLADRSGIDRSVSILGGLAEFERELIRARTGEGRKRAKDRGVTRGWGRASRGASHAKAIQRLQAGETMADVARTYAVDAFHHQSLGHLQPFRAPRGRPVKRRRRSA